MRITIVSAVHGREYFWGMFTQGVHNLQDKFDKLGYECDLVMACSTEKEAQYFYAKGFTTILTSNEWLGKKWNDAIGWAWEDGADYVFIIGSDDIISPKLLDIYEPLIGKEDFFGVERLYFLDYEKDIVKEFTGWSHKDRMSIGCGRMISKKALSAVGGRPAQDKITRGFDTSVLVNLRYKGFTDHIVDTDEFLMIDVKTKDNVNSFTSQLGREYTADYLKLKDAFNVIIKL